MISLCHWISNCCCAGTFVYLDMLLFLAIHHDIPIQFAGSMYRSNVISKDMYDTMTKLHKVKLTHQAFVLSELLMENFSSPKVYGKFKNCLNQIDSLTTLYHKIDFVG